ncbi:MAG: hypothetical protein KBT48_00390 [Firmicutes bacterium]|nr:hypothetical protein [Bacillota bacterium]
MKKFFIGLLVSFLWIASIAALYTYVSSLLSWKSLAILFADKIFIGIGIAFILIGLLFVCSLRNHKILCTLCTFLISVCAIVSSLFYFPFLFPHTLTSLEKELEQTYLLKDCYKGEKTGDWKGEKIVAHSLGSIDGMRMVPSLETFKESVQNGYRAMEVDFVLTSDQKLVCRHLWEDPELQEGIDEEHIPTLETFKSKKILGKYTPLSFQDLCKLLKEYKDVWIVTDTKDASVEEVRANFCAMVSQAQEVDALEVLDRFIVQSYTSSMVETVKEIYPFKNHIYATYKYWNGNVVDFVKICRWSRNHNVDAVSMWEIYYCPTIQYIADQYGLDVYVHTENDVKNAQKCLDQGARGVYSDFIRPKDVK